MNFTPPVRSRVQHSAKFLYSNPLQITWAQYINVKMPVQWIASFALLGIGAYFIASSSRLIGGYKCLSKARRNAGMVSASIGFMTAILSLNIKKLMSPFDQMRLAIKHLQFQKAQAIIQKQNKELLPAYRYHALMLLDVIRHDQSSDSLEQMRQELIDSAPESEKELYLEFEAAEDAYINSPLSLFDDPRPIATYLESPEKVLEDDEDYYLEFDEDDPDWVLEDSQDTIRPHVLDGLSDESEDDQKKVDELLENLKGLERVVKGESAFPPPVDDMDEKVVKD